MFNKAKEPAIPCLGVETYRLQNFAFLPALLSLARWDTLDTCAHRVTPDLGKQ